MDRHSSNRGDRMVMFSIALLLFCFSISNPPTRIFVAVTSVMVTVLIGWCIHRAWESSEDKGMWANSMLPYIRRALIHFHGSRIDILSLILRRESPPLPPYDHSGSLPATPEHVVVDV